MNGVCLGLNARMRPWVVSTPPTSKVLVLLLTLYSKIYIAKSGALKRFTFLRFEDARFNPQPIKKSSVRRRIDKRAACVNNAPIVCEQKVAVRKTKLEAQTMIFDKVFETVERFDVSIREICPLIRITLLNSLSI